MPSREIFWNIPFGEIIYVLGVIAVAALIYAFYRRYRYWRLGGPDSRFGNLCRTGEIVWQSPNPHGWVMTHSSIVPVEFAGIRMYVYCASGGVVGVSSEDGSILWD